MEPPNPDNPFLNQGFSDHTYNKTASADSETPDVCFVTPDNPTSICVTSKRNQRFWIEPATDEYHKCASCKISIPRNKYIYWQTMNFCSDDCFIKDTSQEEICAYEECQRGIDPVSYGKLTVRFGRCMRHFCKMACLEAHKRLTKVCFNCQEELFDYNYSDPKIAYCCTRCERMKTAPDQRNPLIEDECFECFQTREIKFRIRAIDTRRLYNVCSELCFAEYKKSQAVVLACCLMCNVAFERRAFDYCVYDIDVVFTLCSMACQTLFIIAHREILHCFICEVNKYRTDMIRITDKAVSYVCSTACLKSFRISPPEPREFEAVTVKEEPFEEVNIKDEPRDEEEEVENPYNFPPPDAFSFLNFKREPELYNEDDQYYDEEIPQGLEELDVKMEPDELDVKMEPDELFEDVLMNEVDPLENVEGQMEGQVKLEPAESQDMEFAGFEAPEQGANDENAIATNAVVHDLSRECTFCSSVVDENNCFVWEGNDFCSERCAYQQLDHLSPVCELDECPEPIEEASPGEEGGNASLPG